MKRLKITMGGALALVGGLCSLAQAQSPTSTPTSTPLPEVTYVFSGRILEKGNKDPVLGGSLYLIEAASPQPATPGPVLLEPAGNSLNPESTPSPTARTFSAEADLKGNFKLSAPAGEYQLVVGGEGFKKTTLPSFFIRQNTQKDFYLEREEFNLPEVLVSTSHVPKTQVSHETMTKEELMEVPGSQEDVLKAVQALPGVETAGSYNGQLLVRGNGPNDNQYLIDNIPIGYPYHFGITSTFDSNLIKDIDFYSGEFGAQYPNSLGGLVDLTQRDPRSDRWGFRTDVNLFLSEVELEGPITSNSSLAIAGRRSYLDAFIKSFSGSSGSFIVPDFDDYQVKYSYNPSPQVHWDFVALGAADSFQGDVSGSSALVADDPDLIGNFNFINGYNDQGINFRDLLDDQDRITNTLYHTNSYLDFELGPGLFFNNSIEDFGEKFSLVHDFDPDTSLEGGVQYDHIINWLNAYFPTYLDENGRPNSTVNLTSLGKISALGTVNSDDASAFLDQKFKALEKKLEVTVGVRADYVDSDATLFVTPRASAAYHLNPATTLKFSYGLYNESPDRILGGPYLDPNLGNPHLAPEQSNATVLGVEQYLNESGLLFRVEGYEKDFSHLIVVNPVTTPGMTYLNTGTGYARGLEFFLRQPPIDRFFGWISYSLGTSQRQHAPGESQYPYEYDEPN
ncbi:MAG TPA: TonB-dependent receptor plug domain-containing protein, partial [bacterium]|nr:TonB-dependent receptor plug domain-containing protein [bacterium]